MKPDQDMMSEAMRESAKALRAISDFNIRAAGAAEHALAHENVRDLADQLQRAVSALQRIIYDADERLKPTSRISKS